MNYFKKYPVGLNKLLIATGITESGLTDDVELINLDESNPGSSRIKMNPAAAAAVAAARHQVDYIN